MKNAQIDVSKPVWILRDARPYGPFPIHMVARDHVILCVPNDRRLWPYPERVCKDRFISKEAAPISSITQDAAVALSWLHRNEPRVGDLVAYKRKRRPAPGARSEWHLEDEIIVGTVLEALGHQVHVEEIDPDTGNHLRWRITKDACTVVARPSDEQ